MAATSWRGQTGIGNNNHMRTECTWAARNGQCVCFTHPDRVRGWGQGAGGAAEEMKLDYDERERESGLHQSAPGTEHRSTWAWQSERAERGDGTQQGSCWCRRASRAEEERTSKFWEERCDEGTSEQVLRAAASSKVGPKQGPQGRSSNGTIGTELGLPRLMVGKRGLRIRGGEGGDGVPGCLSRGGVPRGPGTGLAYQQVVTSPRTTDRPRIIQGRPVPRVPEEDNESC